MPNILIAKATAALETSVASILNCDDDAATKREALVETFGQFQDFMERNIGGSDIAKADRSGPQNLSAALLGHLHDALDRKRQRHSYQKREEGPLDQHQELISILKDFGPVRLCKGICERQRAPCDEAQLVAVLTKHAGGDRAFARLFEAEESVRHACNIAKSAEFSVFDIHPVVVGGPDAMHAAIDDDDSAVLRAHEEIVRIGREKFPFLPADQQFARVFEDKNYAALAAQAHRRPGPTTVYAMPRAAAYTKADPAPTADTAYAELMLKAEAYRNSHPDLSISQCFAKIYTDRANVELAKRERIESVPR
jgi:hypothetical protein